MYAKNEDHRLGEDNLPIFQRMIQKRGFCVALKIEQVYKDLHVEDLMILKNYKADL